MFKIDYLKKIKKKTNEDISKFSDLLKKFSPDKFLLGLLVAYMTILRVVLKRKSSIPFNLIESSDNEIQEEYYRDIYQLRKMYRNYSSRNQHFLAVASFFWYCTFLAVIFDEYKEIVDQLWNILKGNKASNKGAIKHLENPPNIIMIGAANPHPDMISYLQMKYGKFSWEKIKSELNFFPNNISVKNNLITKSVQLEYFDLQTAADKIIKKRSKRSLVEDDEELARELMIVSRNENIEKCKKIGEKLHKEGELEKMKLICYRASELGGDARWVESYWHGIGNWLG